MLIAEILVLTFSPSALLFGFRFDEAFTKPSDLGMWNLALARGGTWNVLNFCACCKEDSWVTGRNAASVISKRLSRRFLATCGLHFQGHTTLEHEIDTIWKWGTIHNSEAHKNSITPLWKLENSNFLEIYKCKNAIGLKTCKFTRRIQPFKPRIKSHLLFAGIIRSSPFSPR